MWNVFSKPFGERLTWAEGDRGALATKKSFCCWIHGMRNGGMEVKN
jgi:hypothetical protein